ncbi:MAG: hypothetical protein Q9160_004475 [Pyrenula sp. 1 TL-2023]
MRWIEAAAIVDDKFYGPLPDDDIVSTQGAYLVRRPETPIYPSRLDLYRVDLKVNTLVTLQKWRVQMYGPEDAEEWPVSHTPPEIRQRYWDEQMRAKELFWADTPPEDEEIINDARAGDELDRALTNDGPQLIPCDTGSSDSE